MVLSNRPSAGEGIEQDRVHGLALNWTSVEEEVKDKQAARSDRERKRHQCHRASGGLDLSLPHDMQAVGNRLDPGIGPGSHRVCSQKYAEHAHQAQCAEPGLKTSMHLTRNGWNLVNEHFEPAYEKHRVCEKKQTEDRCEDRHGFLNTTKVEQNQNEDHGSFEYQLPACRCQWKNAEDLVGAAGDRDRDGEDVVDEESRPRHNSPAGSKQLRRDDVSTPAEGEPLDDLRVGEGDDKDGDRRSQRERNREICVLT